MPFHNFRMKVQCAAKLECHHGIVNKPFALYPEGPRFNPQFLQSIRRDFKPWSRPHMILAVGGTLNTNT